MHLHERFQTTCRFCFLQFEADSATEATALVEAHERERHMRWLNRHPAEMKDFFPDKKFGQLSKCSQCGTEDKNKRYEWANLNGNYHDVNDYARMCSDCHHKYDQ
jgi:NADH pyrophosphatase NudC (nudix superfamily)